MADTTHSKSDPTGPKAGFEAAPAAPSQPAAAQPPRTAAPTAFWRRWQEWVEREQAGHTVRAAAGGH